MSKGFNTQCYCLPSDAWRAVAAFIKEHRRAPRSISEVLRWSLFVVGASEPQIEEEQAASELMKLGLGKGQFEGTSAHARRAQRSLAASSMQVGLAEVGEFMAIINKIKEEEDKDV